MNVEGDAVYLARLTLRALRPLLRAQHELVESVQLALAGDVTELGPALERVRSLAYAEAEAVGEVTRFDIRVVDGVLEGAWSRDDVGTDVAEAVADAAASLDTDLLIDRSEAAESLHFVTRRFGGTVEVDFDLQLGTGRAEVRPVGDFVQFARRNAREG
jgi:hypothetical protein